jgi:hypothetical protein
MYIRNWTFNTTTSSGSETNCTSLCVTLPSTSIGLSWVCWL